jgi:fucose 4-O-acetylase-like acetyltransferase
MTHPTHTASPPRNRALRALGIMAVFAGIGPLAGALVICLGFGGIAAQEAVSARDVLEAAKMFVGGTLVTLLFAVPLGYMLGLVPALATGAAVAGWDLRSGRVSIWAALAPACIIGVLAAYVTGPQVASEHGALFWRTALVAAHVMAALACWAVARAIFKPAWAV